ncbi:importin-4 [Latimeria chalumnae]|uniref:importin-4 n=1 Tax=Latimeria chalumnae TaxID=7897 RepID=UPI0006D917A9|nr:PREDICTED: importin-4 [Latimeria chalumnae]|eukprot:XP_014351468.1 PREDICTED: importin-4 [Latimeria chalumnae]
MAESLEKILSNLLQPNNEIIQQATAQLKEAFKDPSVVPALCAVLTGSQNPQIRQFAAVLVRRRIVKQWKKLAPNLKENLKPLVLQALQQESEHKVRHAVAQLAAVVMKHETPARWPQLLQFMHQTTKSNNVEQRQIGMLLLSTVVETATDCFQPHFRDLLRLFHQTLEDHGNKAVLFYTIQTLTVMVPYLGTDEMNLMRPMIPKLLLAIKHLIQADEDQASEAMEVFDELMESEVSIIVPHLSEIVHFCLEIAASEELGDDLRVKALSCVSVLIKLKGKAILKQKLLPTILSVLFPIMSAAPPEGEMDPEDVEPEDEIEDEVEAETPKHFSAQVIDMLALHLPPEKLFPHLTPLMEPALRSDNVYHRKAGLMCLAVLAEGCADHIRHKHLQAMLQVVCQALGDPSQVVRNAALFALGQFSEYLQPDISKFSDELMPLLLNYLSNIDNTKGGHLTKAYYALENFVENLGSKIEPYLPTLMDRMLTALRSMDGNRVKELAISAIGAIANAAKEGLLPYFSAVIDNLKGYLVNMREDLRQVQLQSLETLGILARTVGREAFTPLAEECCQLGLNLIDNVDDPDLRRCTYSLFASVSTVMGIAMAPHLEKMTTLMLLSIKSTEGVTAHLDEENKSFLLLEDEVDEEESIIAEEGEEDDESDVAGFSVENAYIDEKEDACDALGEIAVNTGAAFLPYMEQCFEELFKIIDYPHVNVRKAVFEATGQLCIALHKIWYENPTDQNSAALQKALSLVFPSYLSAIQEEKDRQVVMSVVEAINEVLKSCKGEAVRESGRVDAITKVIRDIMQRKTVCQDAENEEGEEEDEQQAEYDAMLIEYAGEGIPLLAGAVGGHGFAPYFAGFLPLLLSKLKPTSSLAEKSFAVGTIAETVEALGPAATQFVPRLLPVLLAGAREEDEEVRSNSVFGLGVLAEQGKEAVFEHYPTLLGVLSSIIAREEDRRVLDNVCGAVSRMISTNLACVPIDQVLPVLLHSLPLKEDLEENITVYSCIAFLYNNACSHIIQHLVQILGIFSQVLGTDQINSDTQNTLVFMVRDMAQRFPQEFQNAMMSLPAEAASKINMAAVAS